MFDASSDLVSDFFKFILERHQPSDIDDFNGSVFAPNETHVLELDQRLVNTGSA